MDGSALAAEFARVERGDSRIPLRAMRDGEGVLVAAAADDGLRVSALPAGAVLIDCRDEAMRAWLPDWPEVVAVPSDLSGRGLEPGRVYVAFCPMGQRSAYVAERLREGGVRAHSFKGGEGALRAYLEG